MELTKQTVYLPVNEQYEYSLAYWDKRDKSYQIEKDKNGKDISLKQQESFVFTSEQLNEYTQSVIKQALETAAEKSLLAQEELVTNEENDKGDILIEIPVEIVDIKISKKSITNTFEETYKKFKV